MACVRDLVGAIDSIAPFAFAEDWDNVGLLVGRPDNPVQRVLCTIDLTPAVMDEAVAERAEAIVSYHPTLFKPFKRLAEGTPAERMAMRLLERGIAVICPHTALDAAQGGLNDWIAAGLGTGDVRALVPHAALPATEETKIVTICPQEAIDRLRDALAAIGAGVIGGYERCSFEIKGNGTFFGGAGTEPKVGQPGRLERVEESRLEMVCPKRALALAVETIRQFHPYEEPVVEIYPLAPRPERGIGGGRRITLDAALSADDIAARLKKRFGVTSVGIALPEGAPLSHRTIGISAGSGGEHLDAAIAQGCSLFVTGECRHHDVLAALAQGCGVLVAGHTNTERGYLPVLAERLGDILHGVQFVVSKADRDPFAAR